MKPYMRYSASGGDGAINEIVRVVGTPEIQKYWTEDSIEQIIAWNQYSMVERDEANEWIYSMNILHPDHNYVNIGIAWNDSCISLYIKLLYNVNRRQHCHSTHLKPKSASYFI